MSRLFEVLSVFTRLGLTSFGGPVAHLGFFHDEFVKKRKWLSEHDYTDLVSLCQFLPGPASSQVGMAIGLSRAGLPGAIAAWVGFTLPSALLLVAFAVWILKISQAQLQTSSSLDPQFLGAIHGLKVAAVAVVAQAVWSMGRSLCPDKPRVSLAVVCAVGILTVGSSTALGASAKMFASLLPLLFIVVGGGFGWKFLSAKTALPKMDLHGRELVSKPVAGALLVAALLLLVGLPLLAKSTGSDFVSMLSGFYRAGSLVFGGGHVVLPLLQAEVVPNGWVSKDLFLAGYGASQAIPGPLFSFSAFLGATSAVSPSLLLGAGLALVMAFLPAFLLIVGVIPFWQDLRKYSGMQRAMLGINAAVVGILLAALYDPIWTESIRNASDFALALMAFAALMFWRWPSWLVVVAACGIGALQSGVV